MELNILYKLNLLKKKHVKLVQKNMELQMEVVQNKQNRKQKEPAKKNIM